MTEKEMVEVASRTFSVGDLAVYPAHGVGRIESIETKEIGGAKQDFYILKILENGMVIMIPTSNVCSVGLREVIGEDDIPKIYEVMKNTKNIPSDSQTWNRRYREYMEKLKTGSLYDVAEVFRDLFLLRITKDLSFGERKLLDTAQSLLLKELCLAKNSDEETMMKEIEKLFSNEEIEVKEI